MCIEYSKIGHQFALQSNGARKVIGGDTSRCTLLKIIST